VVDQVKGLIRMSYSYVKTTQFVDLKQLAEVVLKYYSGLACIVKIAHMECEEVFGSYKQKGKMLVHKLVNMNMSRRA
jgi:hypothetical protein